MLGLDDAVAGGKAALKLVPIIIEVINELQRESQDVTFKRVLEQVHLEARDACVKLRSELTELVSDLASLKIDMDLPLSDIYRDLHWINDFSAKLTLKKHRNRLKQISLQLSDAADDFTAVLICKGKINDVSNAYVQARDVRRYIDEISFEDIPLRKRLEEYINLTERFLKDM